MKLLLSPHNDDESLFCSFINMQERPRILIIYDSFVQPARGMAGTEAKYRRLESLNAMAELGVDPPFFLGLRDDVVDAAAVRIVLSSFYEADDYDPVWAPAVELGGNRHHSLVGQVASEVFGNRTRFYLTYTGNGKSVSNKLVQPTPNQVARKLKALACYRSQLHVPDCLPHFLRSQEEYLL